jgi:hypothetical protein
MESQPLTVEEIRSQMRTIRRDLRGNVQEIVVGASQFFDWKSYVRSFPWTFVAAAAILGYLLVPRRKQPPVELLRTKESVDQLAEEIKAVVAPKPRPPAPSVIGAILPIVGGVALRVGTSYLTRFGTGLLEQLLNQPPTPARRPVSSPLPTRPMRQQP